MAELIIYTQHGCATCDRALRELQAEGVDFEERSLDDDPKWFDEVAKISLSVPVVIRNGKIEVGWKGDHGCFIQ
jgi:glutaredoxin